jgi:hypothetical protein
MVYQIRSSQVHSPQTKENTILHCTYKTLGKGEDPLVFVIALSLGRVVFIIICPGMFGLPIL